MVKYLLRAISSATGFSKNESRGTLLLILITFLAISGTNIYITRLKSVENGCVEDPGLQEWVAEVQASVELKKLEDRRERAAYAKSADSEQRAYKVEQKADKKYQAKQKTDPLDKKILVHDLNHASAEDLQVVRGIGKAFSERIVKYRERLGGFVYDEQLNEVYGLPKETIGELFKHFTIQSKPSPIDINSDSAKTLAQHPYINYDLAWVLINYRKANGDIKTPEDLREVKAISDTMFIRLKPYIF